MEKVKWHDLIRDENLLNVTVQYMENNPDNFFSPTVAFELTHGRKLSKSG